MLFKIVQGNIKSSRFESNRCALFTCKNELSILKVLTLSSASLVPVKFSETFKALDTKCFKYLPASPLSTDREDRRAHNHAQGNHSNHGNHSRNCQVCRPG